MHYLSVDSFGSDFQASNNLYSLLPVQAATQYTLNLENAGFFKPIGVMALLLVTRKISEQSGYPLCLVNLDEDLVAYLERVNFFKIAAHWLQLDIELSRKSWVRNPQTANLLELTQITNAVDVANVLERAEIIFERWLQRPNLGSLLKMISELCSNIYQHSGDPHGFILIQRYNYISEGEVDVVVAVGDLGRGIRATLATKYPELGDNPLNHIQAAMEGRTSRFNGRGGLGLRTVEENVAKEGGYVLLRSETAAIRSYGPNHRYTYTDLASMPGTQVVVEFRAPLRD